MVYFRVEAEVPPADKLKWLYPSTVPMRWRESLMTFSREKLEGKQGAAGCVEPDKCVVCEDYGETAPNYASACVCTGNRVKLSRKNLGVG